MTLSNPVSICNQALVQLGANTISSLEETSTGAVVCNTVWDNMRVSLLNSHPWGFATQRIELARTVAPPVYRYDYLYQLPTDLLRIVTVYADEMTPNGDYKNENDKIVTNAEACFLKYTRDVPVVSEWTAVFQEVAIAKMRGLISYSITRSTAQTELSENLYRSKLQAAMNIDAQEDIEDRIGPLDHDFLTVRYQ